MSTTQQAARINAAVIALNKRLEAKGVKMQNTHANAQHLLDVINSQKLDAGNPEHLMIAFSAALSNGLLRFEKGSEPAVMRQKNAPMQGTHAATVKAQAELGNREKLSKAQEEKEAEAKREHAAERAVRDVIGAFLLGSRTGHPLYGKTAEFQGLFRAEVEKMRKQGTKWADIHKAVKQMTVDAYNAHENEQSKSSSGGW